MTDFIAFARAHGILIDSAPPLGVWRRYPTEDHPRKRNGAIKWQGTVGFVQNWAMSTEVHVWRDHSASPVDVERYRRDIQAAERKRLAQQEAAAKKAQWILSQCQYGFHPYLAAKGFPDMQANIWKTDDGLILVLPMRVGHKIVGAQLIKEDGTKRFLRGQRTSGAELVIGNKGTHVLAEGYATGLAVQAAMKKIAPSHVVHVCFSAGNLSKIASTLPCGIVIADNDSSGTGERVARETGWPYYLPPEVDQDFNDLYQKNVLRSEMALKKLLMQLNQADKIKPFR